MRTSIDAHVKFDRSSFHSVFFLFSDLFIRRSIDSFGQSRDFFSPSHRFFLQQQQTIRMISLSLFLDQIEGISWSYEHSLQLDEEKKLVKTQIMISEANYFLG